MSLRDVVFGIGWDIKDKEIVDADKKVDKLKKNVKDLGKSIQKVGQDISEFGKKMSIGLTAPIITAGTMAIKTAADAEEMRSKFGVVFKDLSKDMEKWAKNHAKLVGRSKIDLMGYLAESQNMLVGMGMARDSSATLSKQIIELGVDLASFNNLAEDHALGNLLSAISGNHEASKALGAVLNENTLAMAMERMQIRGKFKDLSEAEKMQVRYSAVVMQSEDAIGDAARTSDSFTNRLKELKGVTKDTSESFGALMIPALIPIISKIGDWLGRVNELDDGQKAMIIKIGLVVAAIGPLLIFVGKMITAFGTIMTLLPKLKLAFAALSGPIGIATLAVGAMIGGIYLLYKNWDKIEKRASQVWGSIADSIKSSINSITGFLNKGIQGLNRFNDAFVSKLSKVGINIKPTPISEIPMLAKGTSNFGGGNAIVGEQGPELVSMPKSSKVRSYRETAKMLGGSSTVNHFSPHLEITVEGNNFSEESMIDIKKQVKRQLYPMLEEYFRMMQYKNPALTEG